MTPARYIMVGGFLGAGKTTAILRLAERARPQGRRVGLITNDQSVGLVDTTMLSRARLPGRGDHRRLLLLPLQLARRRRRAADGRRARPDVFIAEPVGSCTDLRGHGQLSAAPDVRRRLHDRPAQRASSIRCGRCAPSASSPGRSFTSKVLYVYRKQLEEAGLIVINKVDAIEPARVAALREALGARVSEGADLRGVGADRRRPRRLVRHPDPRRRPRPTPTSTSTTRPTARARRCSAGSTPPSGWPAPTSTATRSSATSRRASRAR